MTIVDIKKFNILNLLFGISIYLVISCSTSRKGESFSIENELLIELIDSTAKGNNAILGFRKLARDSLSLYIISSPNEICKYYYGTEKIKNLNVHLYLYPEVLDTDLVGYIRLNKKMECIKKISEAIPAPDMMKMTEFTVHNGKFVEL